MHIRNVRRGSYFVTCFRCDPNLGKPDTSSKRVTSANKTAGKVPLDVGSGLIVMSRCDPTFWQQACHRLLKYVLHKSKRQDNIVPLHAALATVSDLAVSMLKMKIENGCVCKPYTYCSTWLTRPLLHRLRPSIALLPLLLRLHSTWFLLVPRGLLLKLPKPPGRSRTAQRVTPQSGKSSPFFMSLYAVATRWNLALLCLHFAQVLAYGFVNGWVLLLGQGERTKE